MFWDRGIPTLLVGTPEKDSLKDFEKENQEHLNKLGAILLESINKNNY